ncbi:hypothetical protein FIBSPDRAFT_853174, partial [Athelia psychrophila]
MPAMNPVSSLEPIPVKKKSYRPTSTWHLKPPTRNPIDRIRRLDLGPPEMYEAKGPEWDRGPMPNHPMWRENLFILRWAVWPIVIQWALLRYTDIQIDSTFAQIVQVILYQAWFIVYGTRIFLRAQRFMKIYGTLNEEKKGRDMIADVHRDRVTLALVIFLIVRISGIFVLGKDRSADPSLSIWSPVKIGLFQIALDYFFYVYHRSTHDFDSLWFIHQKHHATKAPTPSLAILADNYQEALEIAIIPFLASQVVPKMSFAELYGAAAYTAYVEAIGHSGIRAYWGTPILGPVLKPLGMDLVVEDHDLHH